MGKRRCSTDDGSDKNDNGKPDNFATNARICQLVEGYPCMYDRTHPDYMKKDAMDAAWTRISEDTGDSINACKDRWRNIRTSFARSINVNKTPASANRTKPYYLHEHIKFLERHITPGIPVPPRSKRLRRRSVDEVREESLDSSTSFAQRFIEASNCSENTRNAPSCDLAQFASQIELVEVKPALPLICPCPPKKRPHLMDSFAQADEANQSDLDNTQTTYTPSRPVNADAAFLQGLLPEMQEMSFAQKVTFKRRIYEVIDNIFSEASASGTRNALSSQTIQLNIGIPQSPATGSNRATANTRSVDISVMDLLKDIMTKPISNAPAVDSQLNHNNKKDK